MEALLVFCDDALPMPRLLQTVPNRDHTGMDSIHFVVTAAFASYWRGFVAEHLCHACPASPVRTHFHF